MDAKKATNVLLPIIVGVVGMLALSLVNYAYTWVGSDVLATGIVLLVDAVVFFFLAKWMFRRTDALLRAAVGMAIGTVLPLVILLVSLDTADFVANTSVGFAIPFFPWIGICAAYLLERRQACC